MKLTPRPRLPGRDRAISVVQLETDDVPVFDIERTVTPQDWEAAKRLIEREAQPGGHRFFDSRLGSLLADVSLLRPWSDASIDFEAFKPQALEETQELVKKYTPGFQNPATAWRLHQPLVDWLMLAPEDPDKILSQLPPEVVEDIVRVTKPPPLAGLLNSRDLLSFLLSSEYRQLIPKDLIQERLNLKSIQRELSDRIRLTTSVTLHKVLVICLLHPGVLKPIIIPEVIQKGYNTAETPNRLHLTAMATLHVATADQVFLDPEGRMRIEHDRSHPVTLRELPERPLN